MAAMNELGQMIQNNEMNYEENDINTLLNLIIEHISDPHFKVIIIYSLNTHRLLKVRYKLQEMLLLFIQL